MAGGGTKYALGLDDAQLRLPRRLFLTATPKRFKPAVRDATALNAAPAIVRSMDDASLFGRLQLLQRGEVAPEVRNPGSRRLGSCVLPYPYCICD